MTRRTVLAVAGVVSGALCLIYVAVALSQNSAWPGIAYFGWLGLVMAAQPILDRRARRLLIPGSLQARLAFLLAAAAAVPLILVVALASDRLERAVRTDALAHEESQAIALGQGTASYIDLHQTALKSLAAQPGLTEMPREAQIRELQLYQQAFPDVLTFALYRSDGSPIGRSDGRPATTSMAGYPNYEIPKATGKPSMDILISPVVKRPIIGLAVPLL